MQQQYPDDNAIRSYRKLTEEQVARLLEQVGSTTTLNDIKKLIFEDEPRDFRAYLTQMLAIFNTSIDDIDDATMQLIQDAWNYFPHLSLHGECPTEAFARLSAQDVTISQLPDMADLEFDADKIDDAVLALLLLGLHNHSRVWKGHDWTALDHLFQKGYITDPASKAKSVMLTGLGLAEAPRLFKKLFTR